MKSKIDTVSSDEALMKALKFTSKDLDANRDGILTEGQKKRVRRWQIFGALVLWMMAAFLAYRSLSFSPKQLLDTRMWTSGAIILIAIWLGMVLFFVCLAFRIQRQTFQALARGQVESISGPMKRRVTRGKSTTYYIGTPEKQFSVSRGVYNTFKDQETCTLYYVPEIDYLLSAEHHPQLHQMPSGTDS